MAAQKPVLLEIGNSTLKIARPGAGGAFVVERHSDPDALARSLEGTAGEIICAPVGGARREEVLERLGGRVRLIEPADLAGFIGASYDTPATLGMDRVLNLLGMPGDGVAVSCGTAITVDAVAGGVPCWGAIMPGFTTAAGGLHARIPVLPLVSPDDDAGLPARTSRASVANGVLLGTAGGAMAIARELARLLFDGAPPRVVITGGDAPLMLRLWHGDGDTQLDDALLFRGMLAVANR